MALMLYLSKSFSRRRVPRVPAKRPVLGQFGRERSLDFEGQNKDGIQTRNSSISQGMKLTSADITRGILAAV